MRPGRVLLIFTLSVFLGGALLAPWLYWLVQWAAAQGIVSESLARNPFHRFVNRALLALALAGIWPLMRSLGMGTLKELGWTTARGQLRNVLGGFGLGFVSLASLGLVALAFGAWAPRTDLQTTRVLSSVLKAALSGLVVGVLEETFFRGAVMGALRRSHKVGFALVLSSAIYALLHFFQRPVSPEKVEWFSGLLILPQMMRGFVDVWMLVPGLLNLTIVGAILGLAYHHTGNLYFSVALHGGWVFWLKFWGAVTVLQPDTNIWFWGSGKLIDGWLSTGVLLMVLVLVICFFRSKGGTGHDIQMERTPG